MNERNNILRENGNLIRVYIFINHLVTTYSFVMVTQDIILCRPKQTCRVLL